jgi:hypothetical protein
MAFLVSLVVKIVCGVPVVKVGGCVIQIRGLWDWVADGVVNETVRVGQSDVENKAV